MTSRAAIVIAGTMLCSASRAAAESPSVRGDLNVGPSIFHVDREGTIGAGLSAGLRLRLTPALAIGLRVRAAHEKKGSFGGTLGLPDTYSMFAGAGADLHLGHRIHAVANLGVITLGVYNGDQNVPEQSDRTMGLHLRLCYEHRQGVTFSFDTARSLQDGQGPAITDYAVMIGWTSP